MGADSATVMPTSVVVGTAPGTYSSNSATSRYVPGARSRNVPVPLPSSTQSPATAVSGSQPRTSATSAGPPSVTPTATSCASVSVRRNSAWCAGTIGPMCMQPQSWNVSVQSVVSRQSAR